MDYSTFERWLQQPGRSQREKLTSIRELWLDRFGELPEQDRPRIQRLIRKKINSKKLKG